MGESYPAGAFSSLHGREDWLWCRCLYPDWWITLPYTKAEKIAFPEGQDDILIHIAGRQGRGRSLWGDLAQNVSSLQWVFWTARERQGGVAKGKTDPLSMPQCSYPGELHLPCTSTSFFFNLSVTVFQRVNFIYRPRLFPPILKSLFVYQNITYVFFHFYGRFAFPCMSAVHRTDIWVGEVEFWFIGGECIISKFKRLNLPQRGLLLFPSSSQTLYPVKHPRGHFCSRHQR